MLANLNVEQAMSAADLIGKHPGQSTRTTAPGQAKPRKRTVFEPCPHHAQRYAAETRMRRAEVMLEGGWALSPCPDDERCRMKPGTDLFNPQFVADHPTYYVREGR